MQTFIPYPDYIKTAESLDDLRLVNQCCNESVRLYDGKWSSHPASKMWRDHRFHFTLYNLALATEWVKRREQHGKDSTNAYKWFTFWANEGIKLRHGDTTAPSWIGDDRVHSTHRSCLLAKNLDWYSQFGWSEKPTPPDENGKWSYHWAV